MKRDFENRINWDLLVNYLSGEISNEEIEQINSWIKEDVENEVYLEKMQKIWRGTENSKKFLSLDVESSLQKVKRKARVNNYLLVDKRYISFKKVLRLAAILVIGLGIIKGFYYVKGAFSSKVYVASTNNMTKTDLLLSDGSKVYLNTNTTIEYPEEFKNNKREIYIKGQAFFDVKRNDDSPFIIHAGNAIIRVLGTSFDVNAYFGNQNVEVVVKSGKVVIYDRDMQYDNSLIVLPGERGVYSSSEKVIKKVKNVDKNFLAWKTGEIIFEDKKLPDVLITLEDLFNVEIKIIGKNLNELRLTATYKNKTLNEIMEIMEATLNIKINKQKGIYIVKKK